MVLAKLGKQQVTGTMKSRIVCRNISDSTNCNHYKKHQNNQVKKYKKKTQIYCPNCGSSRTKKSKQRGKQRVHYCKHCSYQYSVFKHDDFDTDNDVYAIEGDQIIKLKVTQVKLDLINELARLRDVANQDIVGEAVDFYLDSM